VSDLRAKKVGVGVDRDVLYNNVRAKLRTMHHIGKQNKLYCLYNLGLSLQNDSLLLGLDRDFQMNRLLKSKKKRKNELVFSESLRFVPLHLTRYLELRKSC